MENCTLENNSSIFLKNICLVGENSLPLRLENVPRPEIFVPRRGMYIPRPETVTTWYGKEKYILGQRNIYRYYGKLCSKGDA